MHNQGHWTQYIHKHIPGIQISETDSNKLDTQTYLQTGNYLAVSYMLLSASEYQYRKKAFGASFLFKIEVICPLMQYSRGPLLQQGVTLPD